jgi:hypothetical protein
MAAENCCPIVRLPDTRDLLRLEVVLCVVSGKREVDRVGAGLSVVDEKWLEGAGRDACLVCLCVCMCVCVCVRACAVRMCVCACTLTSPALTLASLAPHSQR